LSKKSSVKQLQTTEGRMYTVKQLLASCWLNQAQQPRL